MQHIKKAFILGAGLGTRLRPLTSRRPKPLVPFANRPLVEYVLDHCIDAGITSFAINTHHCAHAWLEHFPDRSYRGLPIDFFYEEELLETGGGIKNIAEWICDEALLVYNGDILSNIDLSQLIKQHVHSNDTATLGLFAKGANCNVGVEGDRVTDMRGLRGITSGSHQFTGIYIIEPEILNLIPADQKIAIIPALIDLAKKDKLAAHDCGDAKWQDLGTIEEYRAAHDEVTQSLDSNTRIHPTAIIHPEAKVDTKTCFLGANCVIEQGSNLSHTIVWPNAIVKANSQLEHCIVRYQAIGRHYSTTL